MNKNGFTLVELLAVIALVAILSGIAVVNVVSSINNSKKNAFLMDARRMISKAEYLLSMDVENRNKLKNGSTPQVTYDFTKLNEKGEFQKDADDGEFVNAFVKVTNSNSTFIYCVCVEGSRRKVGNNCGTSSATCIVESELKGIDKVVDK